MLNLDDSTLAAVISSAKHMAHADARWLAAIDRAGAELAQNPYIERQADGGLLIGSPSGAVYSTSERCRCTAAHYGRPCWHRAAARLVERHDQRQAQPSSDRAQRIAEAEQAQQPAEPGIVVTARVIRAAPCPDCEDAPDAPVGGRRVRCDTCGRVHGIPYV